MKRVIITAMLMSSLSQGAFGSLDKCHEDLRKYIFSYLSREDLNEASKTNRDNRILSRNVALKIVSTRFANSAIEQTLAIQTGGTCRFNTEREKTEFEKSLTSLDINYISTEYSGNYYTRVIKNQDHMTLDAVDSLITACLSAGHIIILTQCCVL